MGEVTPINGDTPEITPELIDDNPPVRRCVGCVQGNAEEALEGKVLCAECEILFYKMFHMAPLLAHAIMMRDHQIRIDQNRLILPHTAIDPKKNL